MGVFKKVIRKGNGVDKPKKGDSVTMEYTGWLYDENQANNGYKGTQFDSSVGRGDFVTEIGQGRVIKGWDDGIIGADNTEGMTLGEKATLIISSDYGYGSRGFPGHIPPNASLVFDVELKAINGKKAS
ncbi:FK506 binding protein proline rotamase rapamycin-binding protein [Coniosporium tulheliwenetii]|uniref:FK506 binding protein proline rotamase rapamycin-binding protein n=1 Tax=Coniosporium tulheliwenetii TaxID=3383036 RepID=A0ACC2YKK0_9PEZI|nr:FK506 binding protein proline rotamase rapamycin-binding protein [Cladosporium sp. JES 115]